mgnify:CR=1 FL=1
MGRSERGGGFRGELQPANLIVSAAQEGEFGEPAVSPAFQKELAESCGSRSTRASTGIVTRYDKLAEVFLNFILLGAFIDWINSFRGFQTRPRPVSTASLNISTHLS